MYKKTKYLSNIVLNPIKLCDHNIIRHNIHSLKNNICVNIQIYLCITNTVFIMSVKCITLYQYMFHIKTNDDV